MAVPLEETSARLAGQLPDVSVVNQDGFLQLGIAGAALLVLVFALFAIVHLVRSNSKNIEKMTETHSKSLEANNSRWSGTLDVVAKRFDDTQRETNSVLRDFATIMKGVEIKIDNGLAHSNQERKMRPQ